MEDADSAIEMIQSFLSEPGAKEKISEALDMFSDGNLPFPTSLKSDEKKSGGETSPLSDINPQKLMQIMTMFKKLEKEPDPRSDLLRALKPYLSKDKKGSVDRAIKMVGILKFAPMLGSFKDIF